MIKVTKKSQNSRKQGFSNFLLFETESGSVPLTIWSGRPKNLQIRSTDKKYCYFSNVVGAFKRIEQTKKESTGTKYVLRNMLQHPTHLVRWHPGREGRRWPVRWGIEQLTAAAPPWSRRWRGTESAEPGTEGSPLTNKTNKKWIQYLWSKGPVWMD